MPFAPQNAHKIQPVISHQYSHSGDRSGPFSPLASHPVACPRNKASCGQVKRYFKRQGKRVVTFLGFSASGYNNFDAVQDIAKTILDRYDPAKTIINGGATEDGIGFIYRLAKTGGFSTSGIVSMEAKRTGASMSQYVDRIFYIPGQRWGGYIDGTRKLSPVSDLTVRVSDDVYLLGGGEISAIEGHAAKLLGKNVSFFPAEMDHSTAIIRAKRRNLPPPQDFKGAAFQIFHNDVAAMNAGE